MKHNLTIKVCGMRDALNIRQVESLGVDMMGFIFYPRSPRYVSTLPDYMPVGPQRVGVFVNATIDDIMRRVDEYGLDAVQLHGGEPPEYCSALRCQLAGKRVIKAVSVKSRAAVSEAYAFDGGVDIILFDTPGSGYGGTGQSFDWQFLESYTGNTPFMLSGGIGPDMAQAIMSIRHPMLVGIDLNSRFETSPAIKDPALLADFISKLNNIQRP